MVWHQSTTLKRGTSNNFRKGAKKATLLEENVQGLAMTRKQKTKLIPGAIIPAATAGSLWDIPTKNALTTLRGQVLKAVWGNCRKLRSVEVALVVLNDPSTTDPLAAKPTKGSQTQGA